MKTKDQQLLPAAEGPAGRPAKRTRASGPAGNADSGEKRGTLASQSRTTRKLDRDVKRDADVRMAGEDKAVGWWEGEGGATPPAKKGGRR